MDSSIFHRFSSHLELNRRVVRLLQLTLRGGDVRHHATGEGRRRGDPRSGGAGLASRSPAAKPWGDHGKIIGKNIYIYMGKDMGKYMGSSSYFLGKCTMFFMNHQNAINMTFGGRKNQPIIIQEK